MLDDLLQQAEVSIRRGVRAMEADRLRGEVKVLHWDNIKEIMANAMSQLQAQVERLQSEQTKTPPKLTVVPGEDLAAKVARLERELGEARKLIAQYDQAMDFHDLVEDFDLTKFEAACEELKQKAGKLDQMVGPKIGVSLADEVEAIYDRGGRIRNQLSSAMDTMYAGDANLGILLQIVRAGRDGTALWKQAEITGAWLDRLLKALT